MVTNIPQLVNRYVQSLKDMASIRSPAVERAFRTVPRHLLIEQIYLGGSRQLDFLRIDPSNLEHLEMIYSNRAFMTHCPEPSSSSLPSLMALMLELLDLQPGMRVLEIGTGTGYNAALMAELVGDPGLVSTIDIQEDVVEQTRRRLALAGYRQIRVIARDGFVGCLDFAPYDRIVATVGCSALSPRWLDQLAPEGVVLIPLAHGDAYNCPLIRIWRENQRIFGRIVGYSTFMAIRGALRRDLWLSEAENHDQYTSIQMREPDAVYPLFEGLMELSKTTPGLIDDQAARLEFFYFLALHIPHTFVLWKGIGLGDHMGSVLLTKDSIELYGSQAKRRYQELERIYRLWDDRGRPRMYEYEIEFLASSEVSEASPVSQQSKWVIERPYFRQLVRL